jgi:hypothetical protein
MLTGWTLLSYRENWNMAAKAKARSDLKAIPMLPHGIYLRWD